MTKLITPCTDVCCIFKKPGSGGQGTNGGCQHMKLTPIEMRLTLKKLSAIYLRYIEFINTAQNLGIPTEVVEKELQEIEKLR